MILGTGAITPACETRDWGVDRPLLLSSVTTGARLRSHCVRPLSPIESSGPRILRAPSPQGRGPSHVQPRANIMFTDRSQCSRTAPRGRIARGGPHHWLRRRPDADGTPGQYGVRISANRVPLRSLGSILRSAVPITVVFFLADRWADTPASIGTNLLGTHPGKVMSVAFSTDGRWLASAGYDSPVLIWDVTRKQVDTILERSPASTRNLVFSPDGKNLACRRHRWHREDLAHRDVEPGSRPSSPGPGFPHPGVLARRKTTGDRRPRSCHSSLGRGHLERNKRPAGARWPTEVRCFFPRRRQAGLGDS